MARRTPYTKVNRRNFVQPDHVEGMGDKVFLGFQCLNKACTNFIFFPEDEYSPDFEIACPSCKFVMKAGEAVTLYEYDLVGQRIVLPRDLPRTYGIAAAQNKAVAGAKASLLTETLVQGLKSKRIAATGNGISMQSVYDYLRRAIPSHTQRVQDWGSGGNNLHLGFHREQSLSSKINIWNAHDPYAMPRD